MGLLTPSEAAAIARGVYRLREDSVSAVHERGQTLGCEGLFALGDDVPSAKAWRQASRLSSPPDRTPQSSAAPCRSAGVPIAPSTYASQTARNSRGVAHRNTVFLRVEMPTNMACHCTGCGPDC